LTFEKLMVLQKHTHVYNFTIAKVSTGIFTMHVKFQTEGRLNFSAIAKEKWCTLSKTPCKCPATFMVLWKSVKSDEIDEIYRLCKT